MRSGGRRGRARVAGGAGRSEDEMRLVTLLDEIHRLEHCHVRHRDRTQVVFERTARVRRRVDGDAIPLRHRVGVCRRPETDPEAQYFDKCPPHAALSPWPKATTITMAY